MHSLLFKTVSIFLCLVAQTWADSSTSSSHLLSTEILYWPVAGVSEPSTLARISYDSSSLKSDLLSYSPPQTSLRAGDENSDELVRVGLYASTPSNGKQWVGTITSLSSLAPKQGQEQLALRLYVSPSNEVYHVSLAPASGPAAASTTADGPTIEVIPAETGPQPHLNRPVVLSEDGQNPEEVVEKTMFQK